MSRKEEITAIAPPIEQPLVRVDIVYDQELVEMPDGTKQWVTVKTTKTTTLL